jgi:hypothetical protein
MGLSQREKGLIFVALVIFIPLLMFRFVFVPIKQEEKSLAAKIESLVMKTDQINLLGQELLFLKRENRAKPFSLIKKIDSVLKQYQLKARSKIVLEEQPRGGQRLVLKLDEINLTELARLVYKIENSKPVILIDNIDINLSYKNKKLFRVSMALASG